MIGRYAGVMLPIASLPARHGIGDLGENAYKFVDMLREAGVRYWQILPLNPLGFGNSPYQPYSSFAGDPLYINLDMLGIQAPPFRADAGTIDYETVRAFKDDQLRNAFASYVADEDYEAFAQLSWVRPYGVFMALKRANGMRSWLEWPDAQKNWPQDGALSLDAYEDEIRYEMYLQHLFHLQWIRLKQYANDRSVAIIGDIPFYVGIDSLDVWMQRENFLLDEAGRPIYVAGVPPDYFSETGQRWGNPIYNWERIQQEGFSFWIERLRYCMQVYDVIRIDHFRAFDTYWEIPASCPTAVEGEWREAPGYALFDTVLAALPGIEIIAEDLGLLRDEVYVLRDHFHFRGMNILQFTFDPAKKLAPERDAAQRVVYTGTHDNDTTAGWFAAQPKKWRRQARWRLFCAGYRRGGMAWRFVCCALANAAELSILPMQDLLGLGSEARINTPGTVGSPNWEWKLVDFVGMDAVFVAFGKAIAKSGRIFLPNEN